MPLNLFLSLAYGIVLLIAALAGDRKLTLKKDIFFLIFLFQSVIYFWVNPTIQAYLDPSLADPYLSDQFTAFAFFVLPLLLTYRFLILSRKDKDRSSSRLAVRDGRILFFVASLLLFQGLFLIVALRSGMLSRRIGFEALATRQANLPAASLLVIRVHDLVIVPCLGFLVYLLTTLRSGQAISLRSTRLLQGLLGLQLIAFCANALLNSRTLLFTGALFVGAVYLIFTSRRPSARKWVTTLSIAVPLSIYGALLVSNLRAYSGLYHEQWTDVFDPTYASNRESEAVQKNAWVERLDCLSLNYHMDPAIRAFGSPGFETWRIPWTVFSTQFYAPAITKEYKVYGRTTAKHLLLSQYTSLDPTDFPTCVASDIWMSFGRVGLVLGSLYLALLFWGLRSLLLRDDRYSVLIALFFASFLVLFEQEFFHFLTGWAKFLPGLGLLLLLNPLSVRRPSIGVSDRE